RLWRHAQLLEELPRHRIAFRMNPGAVERVAAFGDLEEAGGLREATLADAGHLHQLIATSEGAVGLAILDEVAGDQLVEAGDVPQQRDACGVQIDADGVDTRLDDAFERLAELLRGDIVLV